MSESPTVDLEYVIDGTFDDFQVKGLVLSTAPSSYDGLPLSSISIRPLERPNLWEATASYSKRDKDGEDDTDPDDQLAYSWDTGGGKTKITQAIEQTHYDSAAGLFGGRTAPDFSLAINVDSNNEVAGLDIVIPRLNWQETHSFPASSITTNWVRDVARNTGKTNDDEFRGFAPGEVLFLGASGSYSDNNVAVTYKFEASENMEDINIGGDVTVTEKKGHEYLWCHYFEVEDPAAKELVPTVGAAYVAKVYESFSFSDLGIAKSAKDKKAEAEDRDRPGFGGGGDADEPDFG